MNWLFSWLVPVFWVIVFGLFWKRNSAVAIATLVIAWIANSAWSFSSLPVLLNMSDVPNAYVTLVVTLVVGIVGNVSRPGRDAYFSTDAYQSRLAHQSATVIG
jgi:SSS family solute:Na+ symporter